MLQCGTAVRSITPPLPVALAGYGDRTLPADSVHEDLEVRAMVLTDGARTVCLCTFDLLAMTSELADLIRDAVAVAVGTGTEAVLTACTHTLDVRPARLVDAPMEPTLLAALAVGSGGRRSAELLEWSVGEVTVVSVPGEAFSAVELEVLAAPGCCSRASGPTGTALCHGPSRTATRSR